VTEIAFHFNAPDRQAYLCRLLRKATALGSRAVVVAPPGELAALDQALWTFSALDFVAHCRADATPDMLASSPVVLTEHLTDAHHPALAEALAKAPVLINLCDEPPPGFEQFERLIEVVTADPAQRQQARERWRYYAQRGYPLTSHDLAAATAPEQPSTASAS